MFLVVNIISPFFVLYPCLYQPQMQLYFQNGHIWENWMIDKSMPFAIRPIKAEIVKIEDILENRRDRGRIIILLSYFRQEYFSFFLRMARTLKNLFFYVSSCLAIIKNFC